MSLSRSLSCWHIVWLLLSVPVAAKDTFRVCRIQDVEYLLPPDTDLKLESTVLKSSFRYYYIWFTSLDGSYPEAATRLQRAMVWHGSIDQLPEEGSPLAEETVSRGVRTFYNTSECSCYSLTSRLFKLKAYQSALFIQLDYEALLANPRTQFERLAKELLTILYKFETGSIFIGDQAIVWPGGITQNLVETIFELIPIPQGSSLARYAYTTTDEESTVLLNPRITLRLDHQVLNTDKRKPENWNYGPGNQTMISIYKNAKGEIRQAPFTQFEGRSPGQFPNNNLDSEDNSKVLLSSSADLQSSENTRGTKYMLLWQKSIKRNNHSSSSGSNDNEDDNLFNGNSVIVLNNDLEELLGNKTGTSASYGGNPALQYGYGRVFLTPFINIYINGQLAPVHLGFDLLTLSQQMPLAQSLKIERLHQGKYHKMQNPSWETMLLPGDKITF